jgi:hypothetical protein
VPLLIANPQLPRGQLIRGLKRLVEVNGLILEMAGAKPAEAQYDAPVLLHTEQAADLRGIVTGRYKLISDLRKQKLELFDLYADAAERTNVAADHPDLVRQLCASLDGHFEALAAQGERLRGNEEIKVSEERSEQLESLGYSQAPARSSHGKTLDVPVPSLGLRRTRDAVREGCWRAGSSFSGDVPWRIARGRSRYAVRPRHVVIRECAGIEPPCTSFPLHEADVKTPSCPRRRLS